MRREFIAKYFSITIITVTLLLVFLLINLPNITRSNHVPSEFDNFNNETGVASGCYIVPNYIHFIRFNQPRITFSQAVCVLAAYKNHKPDQIFIHTNTNISRESKYWKLVFSTPGIKQIIIIKKMDIPGNIFGQTINPGWKVYHGGDVARLVVLMQFGGIYIDNDVFIIRSLNGFRSYELSLGWKPGKSLQNQIIIANQNARFLKLWYESYKGNYKPSLWYYNAGEYPTRILEQRPFLVHRVEKLFGQYGVVRRLYETKWPEWRHYYAVHLMINHQYLLKNISDKATYPVKFNEINIKHYPIAFRDMVEQVLRQ